jgi:hypothetical protein
MLAPSDFYRPYLNARHGFELQLPPVLETRRTKKHMRAFASGHVRTSFCKSFESFLLLDGRTAANVSAATTLGLTLSISVPVRGPKIETKSPCIPMKVEQKRQCLQTHKYGPRLIYLFNEIKWLFQLYRMPCHLSELQAA